ncbi:MAG TPA: heparinase II/III family protein [Phycisphaerae bacterium]|nr:heparinase II/III family protein [Phycisphaerae bacterium]
MRLTSILPILAILASSARADLPPVPSPEQILSTLRPGHPRLVALPEDMTRVKQLLENDETARKLRDQLRATAEKMLNDKPVVHQLIGPRLLQQSRLCLDRVYVLATLYRLEGDERFAKRAEKEMLAAAAFPDWNPKHFLDTAEMSHALAIGYDWLYDFLSPQSRATIRQAIIEKGLKPGEEFYRKNGWWVKATHNWNQVCNGGMAIGALAIADEAPELAGYILSRSATSIRLPTARLAPDGGWDEGPGYWDYAMRYTACYLAAMRSALGTDFGLSTMPGMAETGLFRIHFAGPTWFTFNYADAGQHAGSTPQMYYFARLFDRPVYAYHQRSHQGRAGGLDLIWYDPRGTVQDLNRLPLDVRFKNIDVAFLRSSWTDDAIFVGFKGGDNRANHSHLDLGTFVLDAAGQRWASDLGPDDYNLPGYFGAQRWTYYRLRTEGQNTLVINGDNQDTKAKAPIVAFASSPQRAFAVADLSKAYAKHAAKVWRGVALLDRKVVVIQDEIESEQPLEVEWVMHTRAEARINGPQVALEWNDKHLYMRATEAAGGTWSVQPVRIDPPQRQAPDFKRLVLRFKTAPPRTRVVVEFRTAEVGGPTGGPLPITPLGDWKPPAKD